MADETTATDPNEPIVVDDFVTLTYHDLLPPETVRFADGLIEGRIIGQRCPECHRVYVGGKGFCALCVAVMGPDDEIDVADVGVVTGYTIVTPVRYYGQTKTEPFVYASVLLDGASSVLGGQEIAGIAIDDVREGLRVRAVWKPPEERNYEGHSTRGWGSLAGGIVGFEWTGEPDVPRSQYEEFAV